MKTLLVDDEPLARVELRRLLRTHPEIEITGEAADAEEARAIIASADRPELVFLDVQMPGASGFDLLAALDEETSAALPAIIFTTAFDQFALQAFEFGAFDYLLKPIAPARLAASLRKLHARLPPAAADAADHEDPPPVALAGPPLGEQDQVFVKDTGRCWLVRLADVCLFESEGNYTRLHFFGRRPLALRSLNALEARLDPRVFFRANRRQIVNLRWVERIEPWFAGRLRATLREANATAGGAGEKLAVEISRRQSQRFRESLSL